MGKIRKSLASLIFAGALALGGGDESKAGSNIIYGNGARALISLKNWL